jgi:hypothetical protein
LFNPTSSDGRQAHEPTRVGDTMAPASTPATVQRTIYKYNASAKKWEFAEIGTRGGHGLPSDGKDGEFFNNLTGARGETIEAVRAGLVDQMMIIGSLKGAQMQVTWEGLANRLCAEAEEAVSGTSGRLKGVTVSPLYLGELYLRWNKERKENDIRFSVKGNVDQKLVKDTGSFLLTFMRANGQLAYIQRQNWYTSTDCEIHVDLNFYYDREMDASGQLGMHKDTGGDNLFVNLIFNNKEDTPGTEWTQDREIAKGIKQQTMAKIMPEEMIKTINDAKQQMNTALAGGKETIEGGTMKPLAFVSWVDELIWHATPTLAQRMRWGSDKEAADALLGNWYNAKYKPWRQEAIFTMSEVAGNLVYDERQRVQKDGGVFDMKTWDKKEEALKSETGNLDQLVDAINKFPWTAFKWTGRSGNELDTDAKTGVTEQSHVPTGVAGRNRANSNAKTLQEVTEAAAKQKKRSFIRTWVRVVTDPNKKIFK